MLAQVKLGDEVGAACGQRRVAAGELDGDDPGLGRRIDGEPLAESLRHARLDVLARRVAGEADQDEQASDHAHARRRVELRVTLQTEVSDGTTG